MVIFPLLLFIGFILHPDLFSFEITTTAEGLMNKFYGKPIYHIGHMIVYVAVVPIIFTIYYLMVFHKDDNRMLFWGGIIGLIGCVILAGDKGALCIILSGFDTLHESQMIQIKPALDVIVDKKGLLGIFYLLPLLPLGASIQIIGLIQLKVVSKKTGIIGVIGLMLLNNPDIEIISSIGAILMSFCYIPLGIEISKGRFKV